MTASVPGQGSTETKELTESIEQLDFSPMCISQVCEQSATLIVRSRCIQCGKPVAWPVCQGHVAVAVGCITSTHWTHGNDNPHGCPYIIDLELVSVEAL